MAEDEGGHHGGGDEYSLSAGSQFVGGGARVLTRAMKKVEKATGGLKERICDRMRSVNKKVMAIALVGRLKDLMVRNAGSSGIESL